MSTDGVVRLWDDESGTMNFQFNYNGGLVQSVLVDIEEKVVVATMQDAVIRVLNLSDPIPQARCAV
jgi:WD40 repeat protein